MTLTLLAALFEENKLSIVASVGLGKDALHIYFGLALFLAVRLIWRRRRGASPIPCGGCPCGTVMPTC